MLHDLFSPFLQVVCLPIAKDPAMTELAEQVLQVLEVEEGDIPSGTWKNSFKNIDRRKCQFPIFIGIIFAVFPSSFSDHGNEADEAVNNILDEGEDEDENVDGHELGEVEREQQPEMEGAEEEEMREVIGFVEDDQAEMDIAVEGEQAVEAIEDGLKVAKAKPFACVHPGLASFFCFEKIPHRFSTFSGCSLFVSKFPWFF